VLPLEEAVVNWRDGDGFYAAASVLPTVMMAPLLAGLIACANIQADLDDKRHLFWRSKPVSIKIFMTIKYFVGLFLVLAVIASPVLFSWLTGGFSDAKRVDSNFYAVFANFLLISLLAYSVCFLSNGLIRKTARAWLIGMAITCFLMLTPFMLPLQFKDVTSDFLSVISTIYLTVTLGGAMAAFVLSLITISRNWHLQTNLKALLWTAAWVVFILMLLFSRQVANIKVLDEADYKGYADLTLISQRFIWNEPFQLGGSGSGVKIRDGKIIINDDSFTYLHPYYQSKSDEAVQDKKEEGLGLSTYPEENFVFHEMQGQLYAFVLYKYYKPVKEEYKEGRFGEIHIDKECYLKSFKVTDRQYEPIASLDLSDCLHERVNTYYTMRFVGNKIVAFIADQCVTISISEYGDMEILGKGKMKRYMSHLVLNEQQDFKIPLIPSNGINTKERIRTSIDFNYWGGYRDVNYFTRRSLVDIHEDEISFYHIYKNELARFDVINWDDEYVYCRFRDARPFTFFEQRVSPINDGWRFVQNGKLYAYHDAKLMIFDIRSERLRKLGHWERWTDDYWITNLEVLENGDLLLGARERVQINDRKQWEWKSYLYLLKNPQ
jgi:hypothetical protein